MKLKKVLIRNFRSIKSGEITFEPQCRVLVGINESGKSNILDALSLLDYDKYKPKPRDTRELLLDEERNDKPLVRFIFDIAGNEEELYRRVCEKVICEENDQIVQHENKSYTVRQYCELLREGFIDIDIETEEPYLNGPKIDKSKYKLTKNWYKPRIVSGNYTFAADYTFTAKGNYYKLKNITLAKITERKPPRVPIIPPLGGAPFYGEIDELSEIPSDHFTEANFMDFHNTVQGELNSLIYKYPFDIIYWKYSDEQLLPEKINLEEFTNNLNICKPLQNMFHLAGKIPIKQEIEKASERGSDSLDNLFNKVSARSTKFFHERWKEYKNIEFSLRTDGDFIKCSIQEQNKYSFQKRSDGFKKFVAFLLNVSTKPKTEPTENRLILIDEPEAGLHPSAQKYFRDELIKLSENYYVVYSTHSIFMIDRHTINRHLLITRKDETTKIKEANEHNYVKEEVILNTLNYSIFEHLKELREINIILEGKHDRDLLETAIRNQKFAFFREIGITHAPCGVSSYPYLIPILELAERKALIISDNDESAEYNQRKYKELGYEIKWERYNDISKNIRVVTGEDFLTKDYLVSTLESVAKEHKKEITLDVGDIPDSGRLKCISDHLKGNDWKKQEIKEFKKALFDGLTELEIEDSYKETFLPDLESYIKKHLKNSK